LYTLFRLFYSDQLQTKLINTTAKFMR
jgi:hypothetical protein